jgi:hypothetical protein
VKAPAAGKLSGVPAIEGPASTKAKARMKLRVRIEASPVRLFDRRLVGPLDNQVLFPDIYTTSGKWFREEGELFRRCAADETLGQKAE